MLCKPYGSARLFMATVAAVRGLVCYNIMFGRQIVRLFPPCPQCSTPSSVIGSYCPHKQPSITARLVGSIRPHKSEPLTLTAAHYCPLEMRLTHTHILTQWHTLTHAQVLSLLPSQPSPKGFKYPYVEGWDCLHTHTHTCTHPQAAAQWCTENWVPGGLTSGGDALRE